MSEAASPPPVERRRFPRRWRRGLRAVGGLLAIIVLGVIGYVAFWRIGPPQLARVAPSSARVGDTVTLDGQGFDPTREGNVVYFDDYSGRVLTVGRTRLEVEVPDIEMAGRSQVSVAVKVETNESRVSNSLPLVVLPSLDPEPGTGRPLTEKEEEEEEAGSLASPNPGYASPRPTPSPR
jgi:IPT/TIG domain